MLNLQERSLNWALQHSLNYGDTDVFPLPFEYQAINHDWDFLKKQLRASNILEWTTRPARQLLSPKAKYGFRVITQLDPIDFIIYAALIYEVAIDIEARRIPIEDQRIFSYRTSIDREGQLFNPEVGYRSFLDRCSTRLTECSNNCVVATTDISDFYNRIYHHRLENALRGCLKNLRQSD